jgi:hypothetical protein
VTTEVTGKGAGANNIHRFIAALVAAIHGQGPRLTFVDPRNECAGDGWGMALLRLFHPSLPRSSRQSMTKAAARPRGTAQRVRG